MGLLQARDVPGMAGETVDARATVLKSQERGKKKKREGKKFLYSAAGEAFGVHRLQKDVMEVAGFIALGSDVVLSAWL